MRRWCVAALVSSFVCACSGAGDSAPPIKAPPPTAKSAAPRTRAPRKLDGAPVVVALRRPTPIAGAEWAWLLPEGKLVTLAPPDAEGAREMLGPTFYAGPKGAFVGMDLTGNLTLTADGRTHALGPLQGAVFDEAGDRLLVWGGGSWSLLSRDGTRLRTEEAGPFAPFLLGDGTVIVDSYVGSLVIGPDGKDRAKVPEHCRVPFTRARRVVCFSGLGGPSDTQAAILSLDTGKELGRLAARSWHRDSLTFAARADGKAIAVATDRIEIIDTPEGKPARTHVAHRRKSQIPAARMAFTRDGKHLCVEEAEGTLVLDPAESATANARQGGAAKDATKTCLFAPSSAQPSGRDEYRGSLEWEAIEVTLPAHAGFTRMPRLWGPPSGDGTSAVSRDRRTAAVLEYSTSVDTDPAKWTVRVVVHDLESGRERAIFPVAEGVSRRYTPPPASRVGLSDDGSTVYVCPRRGVAGACLGYVIATGERLPETEAAEGPGRRWMTWSGEWPEARIDAALTGMGISLEGKSRVLAWQDAGAYVTVEMDPGDGKALRLNLPDSPDHIVRDVRALAGGAVLAFASVGVVELWQAEPVELLALVMGTEEGGAAMFPDGSVEIAGRGRELMACRLGERLFPPERCGDLWAEEGSLTAVLREAKNRR